MNALAKARKFPESASVLSDVMFTCQVLLFRHQKANPCQLEHRVQRSEVRAERLVFLAKDNRHNLLRTCVTRVT